jgi:hypothetical protein
MYDNLKVYLENHNRFRTVFGGKALDINDVSDRQQLAYELDGQMSPENISCDGERPASEVRRLARFYRLVAKELRQLDPSVKFDEPSLMGD